LGIYLLLDPKNFKKITAKSREALKNYLTRAGVVKFFQKNAHLLRVNSATAPALLYLLHPCSRPLFLENLPNQCFAAYIFQTFPSKINFSLEVE
jgi:hypothetical protein